jgi:GNAT superfamily N-acetyltransferase
VTPHHVRDSLGQLGRNSADLHCGQGAFRFAPPTFGTLMLASRCCVFFGRHRRLEDKTMRRALPGDIATLVALMAAFYAESDYGLDQGLAAKAFAAILSDDRFGYVWLIDDEAEVVGYVVLTLKFGMEYGGLMACVDDLFVVPQSRNRGLTTAALVQVRDFCKSIGVRAITVEVSHSNGPAQTVYRRLGLAEAPDRQLLGLALANPAHVG